MKVLYAATVLVLLSTSAQAWETVESCIYSKFYGRTCRTSFLEKPLRSFNQQLEDEKATRASIEKWDTFCKPRRTYDKLGVVHLVYAQDGCEFGRNE